MKIKKNTKPDLHKLPSMTIRYGLAVPLMGILDILTMGSFYRNPIFEGNLFMKVFFAFFAFVGLIFTYWAVVWKITADGKRIRIRPAFSRGKEVAFSDVKKAVLHKKKKGGALVYYHLEDKNNVEIVKIYPLMRNSGLFLERFKRLSVPIEEFCDR